MILECIFISSCIIFFVGGIYVIENIDMKYSNMSLEEKMDIICPSMWDESWV